MSTNSARTKKGLSFTLGSVPPLKLKEDRPVSTGGAASVPTQPSRKFSFRSVLSGNDNNGATCDDGEDETMRPAPAPSVASGPAPPLSEAGGNRLSVRMSSSSAVVPKNGNSPDEAALSFIISSVYDSASPDDSKGDATRDCGSSTVRCDSTGGSEVSRCASSNCRLLQAKGALESLRETIADALIAEARAQNLVESAAATAPARSALAAPAFDRPPGAACALEAAGDSVASGNDKNQETTEMAADVPVASRSGGLVKKDSERGRNWSMASEGDMISRSSRSLTKLWPSVKPDMATPVLDQSTSAVPTASAVPRADDTLVAAFSACDVLPAQGGGGGQNSSDESAQLVPRAKVEVEVESADGGEGSSTWRWPKPLMVPANEPLPQSSQVSAGLAKNELVLGATDKSMLCGAAGVSNERVFRSRMLLLLLLLLFLLFTRLANL